MFCFCSFISTGQTKWHPYAGLYLSMDAQGFYVGPSVMAGVDYKLKKKFSLSGYVHFFTKKVEGYYPGNGNEIGKYRNLTTATLLQYHLAKKENKGLYAGVGICHQSSVDDYKSDVLVYYEKRNIIIPAFRFGYRLPIKKRYGLGIELNGTGPYSYSGDNWSGLDIQTLVSVGCRFIF
jgi:hypothetical protein